ncbi:MULTISPECIES: ABC transporter substrate-binding protein [Streptomycetaceae]|uniref:Putative extracellular solute-binding protein (Transport system associated) n=1 Tax=Streptantibioticus cattleyicolor (strain ATCC 35852 / DSM 46488 / JCM 4925 / NBRC 14057 / NRRL 8057) TaxID=1003195 RepID=F8JW26_STREN|nr:MULTISPECIES: ABC transporter substrate-binding protein [Streptomycetaceae]AEW93196.1 putative extracellular solute-binding protein (transport system associated) [Streptantibioticus cattleyicolor NRRL 8057 = DSM 46488]MYS57920.1 transporter substrate-binding domain-containing protein [Streptomyces sp. SID5468]CCB73557.1 putative polar amino acid ABC transporter substrate-binding protein [Streptantibioticus cattleyicolor NRRL 8057 = DSM 46488]
MRPAITARRSRLAVLGAAAALALAAGCAPQPEADGAQASGTGTAAASCAPGALPTHTRGTLTIGTDKPAYAPWFSGDDPANGKGFESAVAYAVAQRLGYSPKQVTWRTVPFNNAITPGAKSFDFDLNQISISDERRRAVDFSSGYYDVRQALVALKGSKIAGARSVADLRGAKLGAQVGTTSLEVLKNVVRPATPPAVFQKNDLAKSALRNGQVDGILVDLPTAFYITSAEVTDAKVVGQFAGAGGRPEQFGLVLDKGSPLTGCVTKAVDALRADGTLAALDKRWLAEAADAPVLK